ncbi:hypothetical protein P3T76_010490 [Phytophthora citrophthora]|uniref:M96 mating-specific protein family n=2 Tax=Phytophthora citrophthora TaxID=4793 RepID=A0AAD9LGR8_9STRA|nr:hypothetical protein P3T76_010490 [Phytophthora citrophthora]
MMLENTESLDSVFSFLAQIDLPGDLTAPEGESETSGALGISHVDEAALDALCHDELDLQETEMSAIPLDQDSQSDGSLPPSDTSSLQTIETKPKRQRVSAKQQIATLNEEVRGLNNLLRRWQPNAESVVAQTSNEQIPGPMWQNLAARQLERRVKAEEENSWLKEMMQVQILEARNLRRILKRRTRIDMMEEMLGSKRLKLSGYRVPDDNPQVFDNMLQDIDQLYVGVNEVFTQKGIYDLPIPSRKSEPRHNVSSGLFLEISQRHRVPFDLKATAAAMWKYMSQNTMIQGMKNVEEFAPRVDVRTHHVEQLNDTVKSSFLVETTNRNEVKGSQIRTIVRKYVENDSVVLICKNLVEQLLHESGKTSNYFTRTTLRIVIRNEDPVHNISLIDSYFTATRVHRDKPSSRTAASLASGVAAWDDMMSRVMDQVESLAIDESMRSVR